MRLGKDGWARLDTSVPLTLGGVKIPAGNWYLGLNKTKDQFSLMVMEAKALRGKMVPPWMTSSVKAKINAPLEHEKVEESQENLLITAAAGKKDPTDYPAEAGDTSTRRAVVVVRYSSIGLDVLSCAPVASPFHAPTSE